MKNIIEVQEEVKIGNIILEKGDKIKVLKEQNDFEEFQEGYNKCNDAVTDMDFATDDPTLRRFLSDIDKSLIGIERYMDKNSLWAK